jgi:sugar phosphate isomerase/epimerase
MVVLPEGKSSYQVLGENTPEDFVMQYDTANGASVGADPVEPIKMFPGRNYSTHLKEWSGEHGAKLIGDGNIPWQAVFDACENGGGTEWYIVEHESYEGMTPMEAIAGCLRNLRSMRQ